MRIAAGSLQKNHTQHLSCRDWEYVYGWCVNGVAKNARYACTTRNTKFNTGALYHHFRLNCFHNLLHMFRVLR